LYFIEIETRLKLAVCVNSSRSIECNYNVSVETRAYDILVLWMETSTVLCMWLSGINMVLLLFLFDLYILLCVAEL